MKYSSTFQIPNEINFGWRCERGNFIICMIFGLFLIELSILIIGSFEVHEIKSKIPFHDLVTKDKKEN